MKYLVVLLFVAAFSSTTLAVIVKCTYEYTWWSYNYYGCIAVVTGGLDNRTVTEITGKHLTNKSNIDVQLIDIVESKDLTFIPVGISKYFPNILTHFVYNCPIKVMFGDELEEFKKLKMVGLRSTQIETVPGNYLATNPNVEELFIYQNPKLKVIGANLLKPLKNLKYAKFENNLCISQIASNATQIPDLVENLKQKCSYIEFADLNECTAKFSAILTNQTNSSASDLIQQNYGLQECLRMSVGLVKNATDNINILVSTISSLKQQVSTLELANETCSSLGVENLKKEVENLKYWVEKFVILQCTEP